MAIDFIVGSIGDGKTCLETWFVHNAIDERRDIYANYNLFNINYYNISRTSELDDINTQNNLIAIDEGWITADSRRSQSLLNITFSHKMLQSRKIGKQIEQKPIRTDVLISTQDFYQVEERIRNICRYIYKPKILLADNIGKPLILIVTRHDFQAQSFDKIKFPIPMQFNFKHGYVDIPENYDTYEQIDSMTDTFEDRYKEIIEKYSSNPRSYEIKIPLLASIIRVKEDLRPSDATSIARYIQATKEE